jgi:flagellum-specific ATP synthase
VTELQLKPAGFDAQGYLERLDAAELYSPAGKVLKSVGMIFEGHLPGARVGSLCRIETGKGPGHAIVQAEVIGFKEKRAILMPFDEAFGINNESRIYLEQEASSVRVGKQLLGRVIDARGNPIDGKGPLFFGSALAGESEFRSLYQRPAHPLERDVIQKPLDLGVRAINALLTCGRGQRVGIMAGSGVGKSVLLGMMSRHTAADVNVIALIGERGREVREFIERDLGPEGLARSVVIVATSDQSPLLRMRGAFLASTIAEYFRDTQRDVLLMMDSVTRFCMAQREIGLSMGEPPASKGYTPSVFSTLPKLLERAGTGIAGGSITGIYTVLVEGDDMDDPIADSTRSILDGHIVLSRKIAQKNHFPAIDVLQSASRVMRSVISSEHREWASRIREWLATYQQVEDLINLGAYQRGSNPKIDTAILVHDRINDLLRQQIDQGAPLSETLAAMRGIVLAADSAVSA